MTTHSDDFNRADSGSLGANWAVLSSTSIGIKSNACYFGDDFGAGESHVARYIGDTSTSDVFTEGTITTLSGGYADSRLAARFQSGADTCYWFRRANDGTWALARRVAGVDTDIGSGSLALSLPETWRIEASGTGATVTITVKRGGVTIDTISDTNAARITSGTRGGLGGYGASGVVDVRMDNFSFGDLVSGPGIPQNVVATAISDSEIDLTWDAVASVDGYDIERDTVNTFATATSIATNHPTNSFSDTGLAAGTTYYYRVRSVE